jgi:hypothetical protein
MKPKQKCWTITYYFRRGRKKTLLKGEICGCMPGDSREDAISRVMPDMDMEDGQTLVKVCAKRPYDSHYCFVERGEV